MHQPNINTDAILFAIISLQHKKRRDRMESSKSSAGAAMMEEADYETFMMQAEHEIRQGNVNMKVKLKLDRSKAPV